MKASGNGQRGRPVSANVCAQGGSHGHDHKRGSLASTSCRGVGAVASGARLVTFVNGAQVREWLVSADDQAMRLVYAINDSPNFSHYSAVAQVISEGEGCRFVWTVDFLPDAMATAQDGAMAAGIGAIGRVLGAAS